MIIYDKKVNLADYHPSTVAESKEFIALAEAENPEFKLIYDAFNDIFTNEFIVTATLYGIAQWEKILDLYPYTDDTLENRRDAIIMALMSQLPYTYGKLEEILEGICGQEGYKIELTPNDYSIKIGVSLGSKRTKDTVIDTMEKIIPMNLIFTVDLLYNRHVDLERYTHEELEKWTHDELRQEVLT